MIADVRYATYLTGLVLLALAVPSARAALPVPIPPISIPPVPIPSTPGPPTYEGSAATVKPVAGVLATPRNPFMAANGNAEIHNDAWQTDAYAWEGPLGRTPAAASNLLGRDCGSIAFDSRGRLISICIGVSGPELYMLDPNTLATLATFALPPRQGVPSPTSLYQDFTGGGYFYLDNQDRVITSTTTHHIFVIAETPNGGFAKVGDYDLTGALSSSENITSALPDWQGLLWFVARTDGVVGTLNLATDVIHVVRLGNGSQGEIENSFAADEHGGIYIATTRKLYRFGEGAGGAPRIVWQVAYPNSGEHKPGQVDDGTGTTPTVMAGGYVNITDNADPMDVVVYRTAVLPVARVPGRHGRMREVPLPRLVCRVPVFGRGAGDTENSLIGAGRSMIVENNYGYTGPASVENGGVTTPGFARVDINRNGHGCHRVWTNTTESAPTVVSKLSIANGLVYTYTKGPGSSDPWYWTTLDFKTGRTVYRSLAGTGLGYNNNYAGIAISRSSTEYLGTLGGIIAMRDGPL
jgi:hypothetical protein